MKTAILPFLICLSLSVSAQRNINSDLKLELDTILLTDQGIREFLDSEVKPSRKDTLAGLLGYPREILEKNPWMIMRKIDSVNIQKAERIISKYGYPGKTMVGEPQNTAIFYVVQHSGKISRYYKLIQKAGRAGELPFKYVAMMLDRKLLNEGKEQIYGTQVYSQMIKNPQTGKKEQFEYVVPIKNPKHVNKRRKKAGFDSTVEDNAFRLGVTYKVYTWKEIKRITN